MSEEQINIKELMINQPVINIGIIGHVADGKSSLVKCLTEKETQQYSKERERNITIRLGYANAKIWKCISGKCDLPDNYCSSNSSLMSKLCSNCGEQMELVTHVSFVDCPGHNELTSTMLNGSSVMDYTILVESCSNQHIPAPQTAEHLLATQSVGIKMVLAVMNKIDLVKQSHAKNKVIELQEYLKKKITEEKTSQTPIIPIIPISATLQKNIDVICMNLAKLKIPETRNPSLPFRMIVIRSFDVNKPGVDVTQINGGVIGGTITQGSLTIGEVVRIYPGMVRRIPPNEKTPEGPNFKYDPVICTVRNIKSDKNNITRAIAGGLLGIEVTIDPTFTKGDSLSGSLVVKNNNDFSSIRVCDHIIIRMTLFTKVAKVFESIVKKGYESKILRINVNSNNIGCTVERYSKTKKDLYLILDRPVIIDQKDTYATIMVDNKLISNNIRISNDNDNNNDNDNDNYNDNDMNDNEESSILGRGIIVDGIDCDKM